MGRPPIQHHKHIFSFSPEVEVFLDKALDRVTLHKSIRAGGEALKGALSHPVGYLSVIGAVILAAHTIPGLRDIVIEFEKVQAEAAGEAVEDFVKTGWKNVTAGSAARTEEEREMYGRWINDLWNGIKWVFQF